MQFTPDVSRRALQDFADFVCRRYRVPCVRVSCRRKSYHFLAQYFGDEDPAVVKLYIKRKSKASSRNIPVLLHELAHHVDTCKYNSVEHHGPMFVAILADMLDYYKVVPRKYFLDAARKARVKVGRYPKKKAR